MTITYSADLTAQITLPLAIANTAYLSDGLGSLWERSATVIANGMGIYLPLVGRGQSTE